MIDLTGISRVTVKRIAKFDKVDAQSRIDDLVRNFTPFSSDIEIMSAIIALAIALPSVI